MLTGKFHESRDTDHRLSQYHAQKLLNELALNEYIGIKSLRPVRRVKNKNKNVDSKTIP